MRLLREYMKNTSAHHGTAEEDAKKTCPVNCSAHTGEKHFGFGAKVMHDQSTFLAEIREQAHAAVRASD